MILAVRRDASGPSAEALARIEELKAFYGIREQRLQTLLQEDGLLG
jgi:hypothetical protein